MMLRFVNITAVSLFGAAALFANSAAAQVIIPYGDYSSDFEKYLVASAALALLCFSAWRYWKGQQ